ncbi:hypothetical protein CLAFUW4_06841 [Fulvia fulva]|nr:hypothetical protein CLAFUR4_06849 [Fulvia fulva]WPV15713.1 hypothetical protein CLAFUW4_06841 [Fulvia fulva]WPV31768.1 hypothetical protein CLAFUW7_06840 [Fulvia fulva]
MVPIAASKVFAIPELLENIIFQVGNNRRIQKLFSQFSQDYKKRFFLQPNTIEGSLKLKRLMYLAPVDPQLQVDNQWQHCPVEWFVDWMLNPKFDAEITVETGANRSRRAVYWMGDILTCDIRGRCQNLSRISNKLSYFSTAGAARPESSWRRMRVSRSGNDHPIEVKFDVIIGNSNTPFPQCVKWHFEADASLGALFDRFVQLLEALWTEANFFEELDRKRRREDMERVSESKRRLRGFVK